MKKLLSLLLTLSLCLGLSVPAMAALGENETPILPVNPVTPVTPAEPETPSQPSTSTPSRPSSKPSAKPDSSGAFETPIDPVNPATPAAPVFTDVPATEYYAVPVAWAIQKGITNGTSKTTFSPKSTCSTAHILTFLYRSQGSPAAPADNPFHDVKLTDYFHDAALWAHSKGLVADGAFGGDVPCTRSAVVMYLWKLAGSPKMDAPAFTDVAADAAYAQAVAWAVKNGVTNGTSTTTFSPDSICTRGQIVTFLHRAYAK